MIALALNQLPLPLRGAEEAVFSQLLGRENTKAVDTLRSMARADLTDWGFLAGPAGCGKTHALLAAIRVADRAGRRAGYLAPGQLDHPPSLDPVEGFDFLAIDDLESLLASPAWEESLFHGLNRWRAEGCQLLVAAETPARRLRATLPDLKSRLAAMTDIRLRALADDSERAELLRRRARARGVRLSDEVLAYLLRRQSRSPAALVGILDRLTEASLSAQRRITVPFVKALLER